MIIKGKIVHGVLRGEALIERHYNRLRNVLRFDPFKGTLNIQIEKPIDIKDFELKRLEHVLMSGRTWVDVRLAPAILHFKKDNEHHKFNCWIIREEKSVHYPDVIEVLSKENIKEKFDFKTGTEVEIELHKVKRPKYEVFRAKVKSLIFSGNI